MTCKKNFIHDVDVNTITNEQIIALFPSKAVREYLTKINWQFSDREREILYRYLYLDEEPQYENDYVTIPFPFRSGNLVYCIGEENRVGVFCSCKNDEDFFELDNRIKDYSDWIDAAAHELSFQVVTASLVTNILMHIILNMQSFQMILKKSLKQ